MTCGLRCRDEKDHCCFCCCCCSIIYFPLYIYIYNIIMSPAFFFSIRLHVHPLPSSLFHLQNLDRHHRRHCSTTCNASLHFRFICTRRSHSRHTRCHLHPFPKPTFWYVCLLFHALLLFSSPVLGVSQFLDLDLFQELLHVQNRNPFPVPFPVPFQASVTAFRRRETHQ